MLAATNVFMPILQLAWKIASPASERFDAGQGDLGRPMVLGQLVGTERHLVEIQKQEASMTMQDVWKRGLLMLLFAIVFGIA